LYDQMCDYLGRDFNRILARIHAKPFAAQILKQFFSN
jgi:hypothetical protein